MPESQTFDSKTSVIRVAESGEQKISDCVESPPTRDFIMYMINALLKTAAQVPAERLGNAQCSTDCMACMCQQGSGERRQRGTGSEKESLLKKQSGKRQSTARDTHPAIET